MKGPSDVKMKGFTFGSSHDQNQEGIQKDNSGKV
jgi:hypothetical protein